MTYRIFLSYTNSDAEIAKAVRKNIEDAYLGHISIYLALQDLLPSAQWKEELKQRLRTYDAIISIITSRSKAKPWIYIEWSAFWLNEKPIFLLITDEVNVDELLNILSDSQFASLSATDEFFSALQKHSGKDIQWSFVEKFVSDFQDAEKKVLLKEAENSWAKYKDPLRLIHRNNYAM